MNFIKKSGYVALVCSQILAFSSPAVFAEENKAAEPVVAETTDRIIVKLKDNSEAKVEEIVAKVNEEATEVTNKNTTDAEHVKETNTGAEVISTEELNAEQQEALVEKLEADPNVEYAEPDYILTHSANED